MKVNRKTVLTTAAVLGVAALIAGGTIAYFTDKENKVNSFTVGNVDIELYESQLHRMNSGRQGSFGALASDPNYCDWNPNPNDEGLDSNTSLIKGSYDKAAYCTPGMNANEGNSETISALKNGHVKHASRQWGFKDSTIESDAATYNADGGYFKTVAANVVPGQWVRKFAYVKNNDSNNNSDAYVLIEYKVPKSINNKVTINMPSSGYIEDSDTTTQEVEPYFTLVEKNTDATSSKYIVKTVTKDQLKAYKGYEDGEFMVYSAVTTRPLAPGEMTFWSPVNTVKLNDNTQNTDPSDTSTYVEAASLFDIQVEARAIQAKTFNDAVDAVNHL